MEASELVLSSPSNLCLPLSLEGLEILHSKERARTTADNATRENVYAPGISLDRGSEVMNNGKRQILSHMQANANPT